MSAYLVCRPSRLSASIPSEFRPSAISFWAAGSAADWSSRHRSTLFRLKISALRRTIRVQVPSTWNFVQITFSSRIEMKFNGGSPCSSKRLERRDRKRWSDGPIHTIVVRITSVPFDEPQSWAHIQSVSTFKRQCCRTSPRCETMIGRQYDRPGNLMTRSRLYLSRTHYKFTNIN